MQGNITPYTLRTVWSMYLYKYTLIYLWIEGVLDKARYLSDGDLASHESMLLSILIMMMIGERHENSR